jgi:hypothetical protein
MHEKKVSQTNLAKDGAFRSLDTRSQNKLFFDVVLFNFVDRTFVGLVILGGVQNNLRF